MTFEDFIEAKKKKQAQTLCNAAETIQKYKTLITNFYNRITSEWLHDAIEKKLVTVGKVKVSLTEELLGTYNVDAMWIDVAGERVSVRPMGTHLIGTDARFDIEANGNESMIVHDKSSNEWIHVDYDRKAIRQKLNATVFQKLIMDMMK